MNEIKLKELDRNELTNFNGGIAPLLAYAAAYATIYATAHVAAYYKGYSDAHESIEPCKMYDFSD